MSSFVYIITHRESGACYVGKANNPARRWRAHQKAARQGDSRYLYTALRKYGVERFDFAVIEEHDSEEEAYEAEMFFIQYLRSLGVQLYNLNDGGRGGINPSPETRARIGAANTNPSPETRALRSLAARNPSLETRAKLAAIWKGKKHSPETRAKIAAAYRTRSPQMRAKCAQAVADANRKREAKQASAETRAKQSAGSYRRWVRTWQRQIAQRLHQSVHHWEDVPHPDER